MFRASSWFPSRIKRPRNLSRGYAGVSIQHITDPRPCASRTCNTLHPHQHSNGIPGTGWSDWSNTRCRQKSLRSGCSRSWHSGGPKSTTTRKSSWNRRIQSARLSAGSLTQPAVHVSFSLTFTFPSKLICPPILFQIPLPRQQQPPHSAHCRPFHPAGAN